MKLSAAIRQNMVVPCGWEYPYWPFETDLPCPFCDPKVVHYMRGSEDCYLHLRFYHKLNHSMIADWVETVEPQG